MARSDRIMDPVITGWDTSVENLNKLGLRLEQTRAGWWHWTNDKPSEFRVSHVLPMWMAEVIRKAGEHATERVKADMRELIGAAAAPKNDAGEVLP